MQDSVTVSRKTVTEISVLHALVNTRAEMGRREGNETSEFQKLSRTFKAFSAKSEGYTLPEK